MVSLESLKHSDRLREEIRQALSQLLGRSLSETPGYHARALIDAAEAGKSVISVVKTNSVLVLIKVFSSIAYRYLILSVFIKHWLVVFDRETNTNLFEITTLNEYLFQPEYLFP